MSTKSISHIPADPGELFAGDMLAKGRVLALEDDDKIVFVDYPHQTGKQRREAVQLMLRLNSDPELRAAVVSFLVKDYLSGNRDTLLQAVYRSRHPTNDLDDVIPW